MSIQCVLLDRDGVINVDSEDYILAPDEWQPIPGSLEAIARLTGAGLQVAVCSNQSAVGRGMISMDQLEQINERMLEAVENAGGRLAGIFICPHAPDAQCGCRKPSPGLIQQALAQLDCTPAASLFIGDSQRDLEAARGVAVEAWLVRTGNGRHTETAVAPETRVYDDLASAVQALLGSPKPPGSSR